ncbi:restriction endonuclease subunit S [Thalassospira sp. A3_1]|uniref:restriction endonuclease subunit S n=1 Tax=Thalassospira sp. A3_1 TaxID=2821088 RepID=UPI001ADD0A7F|nr:restriction endonuclease subunit S [Thalassospira sp. A3_1]MBO9507582.1 restriction endonuclease subunit S [Thalassospira sp. A3_1]
MTWRRTKVGNIASVSYGFTAKASFEVSGPKFLRITDIQNDRVEWTDVPYCSIGDKDHSKQKLLNDDIVFARTGATTGKSYIVKAPPNAVAASYLIRLRVKDPQVLPDFVAKYFQTEEYWRHVNAGVSGSAQGGFNASKLSNLAISLPPLPEQKRIVAILDEAFEGIDAAIANTQANLAAARELFDSYLGRVFNNPDESWIKDKLNNNVRFIDYRGKTPPKVEKGIRLITAKNVKMGFIKTDPEEFIEPSAYDDWMTRGFPQMGNVLFTTEAPLGNVAQLDTSETVVIGQRLITMQPDPSVLSEKFLKYLLMSHPIQKEILSMATGATVLGIKAKLLKQLPIFYPRSIEDQNKIAANIEDVEKSSDRLAALSQQKLDALHELKQSILAKAFRGELTQEEIAA